MVCHADVPGIPQHTAMVVLFELMIVNNWPINMEAAVRATSTNARWFYLAWYFVAVIVVINVLVAFLLDSFSTRKALNENKEQSMQHIWYVAHYIVGVLSVGSFPCDGMATPQEQALSAQLFCERLQPKTLAGCPPPADW